MGSIQNPRTFNAIMSNEASSNDINELTFATLTEYDNATQKSIPWLAKSWEMAPDGLTWTFHLRKGAQVLGRASDYGGRRSLQFSGRVTTRRCIRRHRNC